MNSTTPSPRKARFRYRLAIAELATASVIVATSLMVAAVIVAAKAHEDPTAILGWRGAVVLATSVGLLWLSFRSFAEHLRASRIALARALSLEAARA